MCRIFGIPALVSYSNIFVRQFFDDDADTMGLLFDVSENRLDEVRKRLEQNFDDINMTDTNGNTALHLVSFSANVSKI